LCLKASIFAFVKGRLDNTAIGEKATPLVIAVAGEQGVIKVEYRQNHIRIPFPISVLGKQMLILAAALYSDKERL
jgi:hypothetical protein